MAGGLTVVPDLAAAKREVDQVLRETLVTLSAQWSVHTEGLGVDVLSEDLPGWLLALLATGGKRLRTTMVYWGFIAAGGVPDGQGYRHMLRAAAAIELLHLFALIHDDVMDESDQRRGRPSAHVQATLWHRTHGARGESEAFGRNLAILLGDLAHALADGLVDCLPESMRRVWRELSVELIAGQRADLTGAAAGRRDRSHAEHVARTKSGRYTVTRPLQLGAAAAGAQDSVVDCLTTCGDHLGRAFALRDDLLGVWGDPALTGKPAGDDLFEGKATVLLSLARERLTGESADLLARVGTPAFTHEDVPTLADLMRRAGVEERVETMITEEVDEAMDCLAGAPLARAGVNGLTEAAQMLAWRTA
ncbi:polyprenyl synthetase family protein [Aestuariimicrobium soli]|uniref:polyprenyl synthetase family protein n=1 Tax=Aestuariimicrobium soli TaxID=2035834 RepID=UPI003EB8D097